MSPSPITSQSVSQSVSLQRSGSRDWDWVGGWAGKDPILNPSPPFPFSWNQPASLLEPGWPPLAPPHAGKEASAILARGGGTTPPGSMNVSTAGGPVGLNAASGAGQGRAWL